MAASAPLPIARAVAQAGPHGPNRLHLTTSMVVRISAAMVALVLLEKSWVPAVRNVCGGRIGAMLAFAPAMIVVGLICAWIVWYERPTQSFSFPTIVDLPGWAVWSVTDDMLVLVKHHSTICLVRVRH